MRECDSCVVRARVGCKGYSWHPGIKYWGASGRRPFLFRTVCYIMSTPEQGGKCIHVGGGGHPGLRNHSPSRMRGHHLEWGVNAWAEEHPHGRGQRSAQGKVLEPKWESEENSSMKRRHGTRFYSLDMLRRVCTQPSTECQSLSGKRAASRGCASEHGVVEPK